jgi:HlyD family secretion protein
MTGHLNGKNETLRSMRRALLGGAAVASFLAFGIGGWAATTELSGAIMAPGVLVVDSSVKKVQHPFGGVVAELRVRDGAAVAADAILIRLDETVSRANFSMVSKSIDELTARQARLKAEQLAKDSVAFPPELALRSEVGGLIEEETRLFAMRRDARRGQSAQLRERIEQLREQANGMADQVRAKGREISLIAQELKGVRELWSKDLVPINRVTAVERDAARLEGEKGALVSGIAQVKGKITETELQIVQIDQDMRSEVGKELAEIRGKLGELAEKKITAQDQLQRTDIRAPQEGVVHQLSVHTVGGVIAPGEQLMLIVPGGENLAVEARIGQGDIDQVRIGNPAILRFSAFNQRTTPELNGEVSMVSADVAQDQKTGASFYTVRITPNAGELERLGALKLVPGMPVEGFIRTGERTVLSYLIKPLQDQLMKTWREK